MTNPHRNTAGCQFWHIPMGRQKQGQTFKSRRDQTLGSHSLGTCPKGNATLSLPSSNFFTEASQQLHLNWVKMSQSAFFQVIFPDTMKDSFLHTWNSPSNQKIPGQGKTLFFGKPLFKIKGLKRSLSIWTGKPCPCASKMSKENY